MCCEKFLNSIRPLWRESAVFWRFPPTGACAARGVEWPKSQTFSSTWSIQVRKLLTERPTAPTRDVHCFIDLKMMMMASSCDDLASSAQRVATGLLWGWRGHTITTTRHKGRIEISKAFQDHGWCCCTRCEEFWNSIRPL